MSRILRGLTLLSAVTVITACANPNLTPIATDSTQATALNPQSAKVYVQSNQPSSVVLVGQENIEAFKQAGALFRVRAVSRMPEVVEFGPTNIEVSQGGRRCEVLGYEEALAKIRRQENMKQALNMFAMVLGGVSAVAGARAGGFGGAAAMAVFPITAVNATANIQNSDADIKSFGVEGGASFLTKLSLQPNSQLEGLIAVDGLSASEDAQLVVTVGGDTHVLSFKVNAR